MASLVQDLIEAGIHFGQRRSNWNPKMRPYIHSVRNQIHIIDIKETIKGMLLAKRFIARTVGEGRDVCFVGTKRQAKGAIEQYCSDVKMPYVTERWLGGTLTNFRTIRDRLKRLEELEKLVETGEINNYSKKMESQLLREQRKIFRNLNGIRSMTKMPGAMVVVDTTREFNALKEARNLGIPTICLIDTDGDPDLADIPIPGNDDSMRAIDIVIRELCAAVHEGKTQRATSGDRDQGLDGGSSGSAPPPRRRSSRSQFRADDSGAAVASASVASPAADGSAAPPTDHASPSAGHAPSTSAAGMSPVSGS
ncbi:MAG TPA: 30S ribosomal protein S2 [Phycisphaerales bacterium]|nr:30S ribosomal protein S2 [Phycisphaerales bacterium]HMP38393.1 30S ribosomal protein S2 [Phycisphaerales bacterium]